MLVRRICRPANDKIFAVLHFIIIIIFKTSMHKNVVDIQNRPAFSLTQGMFINLIFTLLC
jgi:hypothetical protein